MILTNRLFERVEPSRDAKLIIIYCEGKVREDNYFKGGIRFAPVGTIYRDGEN